MTKRTMIVLALLAGGGGVTGASGAPAGAPTPASADKPDMGAMLGAQVVPWSARPEKYAWGEKRRAFRGETHGTRDLFVATFSLQPGLTVHPPHRHAQEEFMTIQEGEGTWHLDGKDTPARKGDVIYTSPWMLHGLTNTGTKPLVYFVVQFHAKGVPPAEPPATVSVAP